MSKITRKLVLSLLTVVLTVVALGTTTFAWFTLTNTSTVQPFEAEIVGDTGIEIALGAHSGVASAPTDYDWKTTLTTADVENYIASAYGGTFQFGHVTTADGVNFFTLGSTSLTSTSSGYLEIPLNFRSNSANQINWTNILLESDAYSWTIDVDFTGVSGALTTPGTLSVDASNGMRIAMISEATYGGFTVGYEKPAGGSPLNVILDGDGLEQDLSNGGVGVAGAMSYYYAKNNSLPFNADAVTVLDTIQALGSGQPVVSMDDVSGSTTNYEADFFGQVMVRIWLEGWDANTYNSILSQIVSTTFAFEGVTI